MANIIKKAVEPSGSALNLYEAVGVAVGKSLAIDSFIEPQLLNRFTGGSSMFNAVAELFGAGLVGSFAGKNIVGKSLSTAMVVSAGDNLMSMVGLGQNQQQQKSQSVASQGSDAFGQSNLKNNTIQEFI